MTIKQKMLGGGIVISILLACVLMLTIFSFTNLSSGFSQVVEKSATGVTNSRATESSLVKADRHLSQVSGEMLAVVDDINRTNMTVRVLERKIKQLSATLNELVTEATEIGKELPEGLAKDNLDDLTDTIGDIEESMRREALVSLGSTVDKMREFTQHIDTQVTEINQLSGELNHIKTLSSEVVSANQDIQSLAEGSSDEISLSQNIISMVLGILVLLSLGGVLLITGSITKPLNRAVEIAGAIANGKLDNRIDIKSQDEVGQLLSALKTMQKNIKEQIETERQYAAETNRIKVALDNVSGNVMVADADNTIIYLNKAVQKLFLDAQEDIRQVLPNFDANKILGSNVDIFHKNPAHQQGLLANLSGRFESEFPIGSRTMRIIANPAIDADGNHMGTAVEWSDRTQELAVEQEVENIVAAARNGNLSQRIDLTGKTGFFNKLGGGINELLEVTDQVISQTISVLEALSKGDLTQRANTSYGGSFGSLADNINQTIDQLNQTVAQILSSSSIISSSSEEISSGNDNMSQRTESQASCLEETASTMEQFTSASRQSAENAKQASCSAKSAQELAEKGGSVVSEAVAAMGEINNASNRIADIISVIDDIAFQTNLLALNASVEAARAGEQGRGFAVVSSEVRNLAGRSATAAKEIKSLIQDSVEKVNAGTTLVNRSGETLVEIVTAVKQVGTAVAEIAATAQEQSLGIAQANQAVTQLDEMTQQNAALAEETSAASHSLNNQATDMANIMSFFRTSNS
ncbi:MAG: methyl-accepting chemotaxis protein [Candidatus Polarisedimenticolaceae bacterium]|nr:methyl-accepting chemotaxis protein [Candidatus Polarisedimenticolaceae bacterium]